MKKFLIELILKFLSNEIEKLLENERSRIRHELSTTALVKWGDGILEVDPNKLDEILNKPAL